MRPLTLKAMTSSPAFARLAQSGSGLGGNEVEVLALVALNEGRSFTELQIMMRWSGQSFAEAFNSLRGRGFLKQRRGRAYIVPSLH